MKINRPINPSPLRQKAYMPIGNQLDAIIKTFAHLQKKGIDIGPEGRKLIQHSESVKAKFKKRNN